MQHVKEYLKSNQPIVYETLKNAFYFHHTSHAYLIVGAKGAPILSIAQFMVQSFICQHKDENQLACEECINCQKIIHEGYADYQLILGENLKADAVLSLQEEYNKSAIEQEGIKIYIIHRIERAPIASLNKLLKFIEEPNKNIIAIFTTNALSSVLPTITSRCQIISLKDFTLKELVDYLQENGMNQEDSYLISRISNNAEYNLELLKSETFPILKEILYQSLQYLAKQDDYFIVYMQVNGLKKLQEINELELYLDMLEACLLEAIIVAEEPSYLPKFFAKEIKQIASLYVAIDKMIFAISQTKNALLSNANSSLTLDKMLIDLLRK